MNRMEKSTKTLLIAAIAAAVINMIPYGLLPAKYLGTIMWCAVTVAWIGRVNYSIVQNNLRRYLSAGGVMLILLFLMRICRYNLIDDFPTIGRYLWYAYYVPFIVLPLIALLMALCIGRSEKEASQERKVLKTVMWSAGALLLAAIMTNDLHGSLLKITYYPGNEQTHTYGWMLYLVMAWMTALSVTSFVIIMKRCVVSGSRKRWYIPAAVFGFGAVLYLIYYLNGGNSPELFGVKLYLIQEVCVILFAGVCEACIDIGLIPSNSGYRRIFGESEWNVTIADAEGRQIYTSGNMDDITPEMIKTALSRPITTQNGYILRAVKMQNGITAWMTDVSGIMRINREITEATRELEDENEVIRQEAAIKLKRASFEAQNRLYDSIIPLIRPQLDLIDGLLKDPGDKNILSAMLICIYIKRRFNLAIVTEDADSTDVDELYLAIRETTEALADIGILAFTDMSYGSPADDATHLIDSKALLTAYEFFEKVIELAAPDISGLFVNIGLENNAPHVRILLKTSAVIGFDKTYVEKCAKTGAYTEIEKDEDATAISLEYR
ncbi:MAG: hypothetical protein K6E62_14390 [Lachnospiraceae bacterium]|nr:hypothetical protein [Lachnospiraceae bacterium]